MLNTPYDSPETQPELRVQASCVHNYDSVVAGYDRLIEQHRAGLQAAIAAKAAFTAKVSPFRVAITTGIGGARGVGP